MTFLVIYWISIKNEDFYFPFSLLNCNKKGILNRNAHGVVRLYFYKVLEITLINYYLDLLRSAFFNPKPKPFTQGLKVSLTKNPFHSLFRMFTSSKHV